MSAYCAASSINDFAVVFLITALILIVAFIVLWLLRKADNRSNLELIANLERQLNSRDLNAEAALRDLDFGLIAYSTDRRILLSNKAAAKLLGADSLPRSLEDFLTEYGEHNSLKARFILSKSPTSAQYVRGSQVLKISVKQSSYDRNLDLAYIVTLQDVTDQEQQEKQRKEFVANVSHELKTPLTTVITYSESLLDWGLDEKRKDGIRKDLVRIHDDAIRMEGLVTDLLFLSSIDSRQIQSRMELLDFSSVVKQTVDRMMVQAKEKNIKMSFSEMTTLPPIFGSRSSIERIISNLISNAIKYTDPRGFVKVYVGRVVESVYVKVTDNGHGIDRKHINQIFDRFYRVDMTGARMYGGTGLGLAIAKELVTMHMGQIAVQSAIGQGSSFTVMIPIASKVYADTLQDVHSNVSLHSELRIASAKDLVAQINEQGASIDTLQDLSADKIQALIKGFAAEAHNVQEAMQLSSKEVESAAKQ